MAIPRRALIARSCLPGLKLFRPRILPDFGVESPAYPSWRGLAGAKIGRDVRMGAGLQKNNSKFEKGSGCAGACHRGRLAGGLAPQVPAPLFAHGQISLHRCHIKEVVTQLPLPTKQHRHQLIILRQHRPIDTLGIDVDDIHLKRLPRRRQRLQGRQHVVAEMTPGAAVQGEAGLLQERGLMMRYCVAAAPSPLSRRTSRATGFLGSSLATMSLNCFASFTSTLLSCRIMSPALMPAWAAAPSAASTSTPSTLASLRWASVRFDTCRPTALATDSGFAFFGVTRAVAPLSSSSMAMVTGRSSCWPLRQTVTVALLPMVLAPTWRGRSALFSTAVPLNLRMMSPTRMPALSAGPPASTSDTSAPRALPRPSDSATSLLTSPICTPSRPRDTLPVLRSWSATRIASSIGTANEMPL